jgi:hypothetical protein
MLETKQNRSNYSGDIGYAATRKFVPASYEIIFLVSRILFVLESRFPSDVCSPLGRGSLVTLYRLLVSGSPAASRHRRRSNK